MRQVKRLLPYVRRYVQMAVYDVLDAEGAEYRKEESGAVVARLSVYGNANVWSYDQGQWNHSSPRQGNPQPHSP